MSLVFGGTAAALPQSDREAGGLRGDVQKVIEELGETMVMTSLYDRAGNLIESEIRYVGGGETQKVRLRTKIERDADGRKMVERSFEDDGTLNQEKLYVYDETGNLTEEGHYQDGNLLFKFVNVYDEEGNKVESTSLLHNGSIKSKSRYSYDRQGNMTSMSSFKDCTPDQDCKTLEYRAVHTYDSKGHVTETFIYQGDGTLDERRVYTYNANGQEQERVVYNADGSIREKKSYAYEYDPVGNWIKKTTAKAVSKEGAFVLESVHIVKRTVTYYK